MTQTETERLILYGIKHLIERETWTPEMRKELDKDLCNKIVDYVAPKNNEEEDCCDMSEEESPQNNMGATLDEDVVAGENPAVPFNSKYKEKLK
jgi:hypothetical protein